jgi:hypothetical protein
MERADVIFRKRRWKKKPMVCAWRSDVKAWWKKTHRRELKPMGD